MSKTKERQSKGTIRALVRNVPIIPVLQGFEPADYVRHLADYGERIEAGQWVGVGSVCKRNADPAAARAVLEAIRGERPDLRLHGFGLKVTALECPKIRELLYSADSMAWSFAARWERQNGRRPDANPNDWREAANYARRIESINVKSADSIVDRSTLDLKHWLC